MAVVVYTYGVPSRLSGSPVEVSDAVDQQLRLAHDLRNDLVRIQLDYDDAVAAVWSAHPRVAELEETIATLDARVEQLVAATAKERSAMRGRGKTASSDALAATRKQMKEARQARREAISAVREKAKPDLDAATAALREATKAKYVEYCQNDSLYWATFNDVTDKHRVAVDRIRTARAAGKPAQLRFHRFDGSGSITVQLQRGAGMPPRTPSTIAEGTSRWRNVLQLNPWVDPQEWENLTRAQQRRDRLGQVRFYLGHGAHAVLPILVHRMLPADADITGAKLVVRKTGGHRKVELHVTARVPDPPASTYNTAVALHLGWRRDDRGVRVATWRSTTPVAVPPDLHPWAGADTPHTGWVSIPSSWRRRVDAHDGIRSDRDVHLDKIRAEFMAWLDEHGPLPHPTREDVELTSSVVSRWRSPNRFAVLALAWRDDPPDRDLLASLEVWRAADRRQWESESHGRVGAIGQRDDAYRRIAAWLCGIAGTLVVDDTAVSELARRPNPAVEPDQPTAVVDNASRQRTLAAPGRLREIFITAAKARGVQVVTVAHTGTTRTHYRCGHLNPADGRYALSRTVTCDGCGQGYDQDASATLMMFAASGHARTPGS